MSVSHSGGAPSSGATLWCDPLPMSPTHSVPPSSTCSWESGKHSEVLQWGPLRRGSYGQRELVNRTSSVGKMLILGVMSPHIQFRLHWFR